MIQLYGAHKKLFLESQTQLPWNKKDLKNKKRAGVAPTQTLRQNCYHRQGYLILIKTSIYQEGITIINTYAPKNRVPKYTKTKRMKGRNKTIQQ